MDRIEELRKRLIGSAKRQVQEKYEDREVHIIKSVNLLSDLDDVGNLLVEQLREWYSAHFPELSEIVKDNDVYAQLVYTLGERSNFTEKKVKELDEENASKIAEKAKNSMGSKIEEKDLAEIKTLALNAHNLREQREYLTKYLEENMKSELPNFTELAGPVIGAKILSKVGSKRKLAFLPASGIQVVGAEKALFLHKKKGVKGPKYGYLFQHPLVRQARYENKGKIARSLAAKLAIAVRKDYFHNNSSAKELKKELDERVDEVSKRPAKEKPRPEKKERHDRKPERKQWKKFSEKPRGKQGKTHPRGKQKNKARGKDRKPFGDKGKKFGKKKNKR